MKKNEFLDKVKEKLAGLSEEDIKKAIDFYDEAINDRIEDGLTEDQAVSAIGTPEDIAEQILMDTPLPKLVKAKAKPNRALRVWEIILIVLGFPLWFPLLLTVAAIGLTIVITIFAVIFSLFVLVLSLAVSGIVLLAATIAAILFGEGVPALLQIGAALICIGLGILLFIPVKALTLWLLELMGRFVKWIKSLFIKGRTKEAIK
ncbi:MAG: DUF1700 domain-containing protein [Clostridiales bacterium]|nr:DUF1700 domain-containing protein [Clostridiales bacterium]